MTLTPCSHSNGFSLTRVQLYNDYYQESEPLHSGWPLKYISKEKILQQLFSNKWSGNYREGSVFFHCSKGILGSSLNQVCLVGREEGTAVCCLSQLILLLPGV